MAIIYTYPPVTNPDGTELIVVSETKNKNSTRLITLAGICEFCDESTGCDHSFRYIQTSSLNPAKALGCDDTLTLTSADGSVTITNLGNTVDFKSSGGPGGCPTTYVLKEVYCNTEGPEPICTISEVPAQWVFTCEESFADKAPGYVSITNNGTPVPYNVDEGEPRYCWYVEEWAPVPTAIADCDECCEPPADPVLTVTPCGPLAPGAISTLQSNISGPVGWESAIDNPCEFAFASGEFDDWPCLEITSGGIDMGAIVTLSEIKTQSEPCSCTCCLYPCSFVITPCAGEYPAIFDTIIGEIITPAAEECVFVDGNIVRIDIGEDSWCFTLTKVCDNPTVDPVAMALVTNCEDPSCTSEETLRWKSCSSEVWLYETDLDPIPAPFNTPGYHYLGDLNGGDSNSSCIDSSCCIEVETTLLVEPLSPWSVWIAGLTCDTAYSGSPINCECCEYTDVATYNRCAEECFIEGYPDVNIDVCAWGNSLGETWKPTTAPDFIKIDIGGGTLCCYEKDGTPPCASETLISGAGLAFADLTYDLAWSTCEDCEGPGEVYVKYDSCDDPTGDKWVSATGTPGSESWLVGQVIKQGGTCYEVLENPSVLTGFLAELPGYIGYSPSVDCECCGDGPNRRYTRCSSEDTIVVDPSAWAALDDFGIDDQIRIEPTAAPGTWTCWEFSECTSDGPDGGVNDIQISTSCSDVNCQTFVELQSCDGVYTEKVALANLVPDGSSLIASDVIGTTGGSLASLSECWTVININAPGPETQAGIQNWTGPLAGGGGLTACDCCEQDLRTYIICDGAAGVTCNALAPAALYIDVSLVPGWDSITYANIIGEEISTGIDCCYEYNEELPSCTAPTGTITSTVANCEDPACNFI